MEKQYSNLNIFFHILFNVLPTDLSWAYNSYIYIDKQMSFVTSSNKCNILFPDVIICLRHCIDSVA